MAATSPRWIANGNIRPSRFVQPDATKDFTVLEVDTAGTDKIVGVSQAGVRRSPGVDGEDTYAAHQNELLQVHGPGEECLVEAGAAVVRGDWLKADSQGRAIPVTFTETANTFVGGFALEFATGAGSKFRMLVNLACIRPA